MSDNNTCNKTLAMASIPKQEWGETYKWCQALKEGTIFPDLNMPFFKAPIEYDASKSCNHPSDEQLSREEMMTKINSVSFALNDLTLYLDTHPECPNATPVFHELMKKRLDLLALFAQKYYPLTQASIVTGDIDNNKYGWDCGPMPWEGACI